MVDIDKDFCIVVKMKEMYVVKLDEEVYGKGVKCVVLELKVVVEYVVCKVYVLYDVK